MKKITLLLILAIMLFTADSAFSQATRQLNFGFVGVSYDIPVAKNIAIAPFAATNWDFNHLTIGAKGNYWFDSLMGLSDPWDVYAGANLGYGIDIGSNNDSKFAFGLQAGGRWFWNEKWGLYLEIGGGSIGGTGGLGFTMKL